MLEVDPYAFRSWHNAVGACSCSVGEGESNQSFQWNAAALDKEHEVLPYAP